jgi:hypothetical protein
MKTKLAVVLVALVVIIAQAQTAIRTTASPVSRALVLYSRLSGKELVIEQSATNQVKTIHLDITLTNSLTKAEVAKVIEAELRKQANIVITPIDDKKSSVKLAKK